jgi:hypothetical protein
MSKNLFDSITNFMFNCSLFSVETLGSVRIVYNLNEHFNLNKFTKTIENITKQIEIPIYIVEDETKIFLKNIEIYFIIRNNKMIFISSHKYYDGKSVYLILNIIDNEYKNNNDNLINYINKDNLIKDVNTYSSFLNNYTFYTNHFQQKDDISEDYFLYKKKVDMPKTKEILNELKYLLLDYMVVLDIRKTLNISENTLGSYYGNFYVENENLDDLVIKLKQYKSISDLSNSYNIANIKDKKFILVNCFLPYKIPSFCKEQLPLDMFQNSDVKYHIFIPPRDSNGNTSIFICKELHKLMIEKQK